MKQKGGSDHIYNLDRKGCGCRILLETLKHTIQVKKNLCGQTREWIARTDGTYFQRNRIKPAAFVFPWINKKP
ncbi:hypothetical protein YC2023_104353 [Brassica napus]